MIHIIMGGEAVVFPVRHGPPDIAALPRVGGSLRRYSQCLTLEVKRVA